MTDDDVPPSAQVVVRWGDDLIEALDEPAQYHAELTKLPDRIANVICVELLDWQVRNGGFHQYFYNSYGIGVAGAVKGFEAMGLSECADIARAALAQFKGAFPEDRLARIKVVGETSAPIIDFDAQDDAYYGLDMGQMYSVLDAYARIAMGSHTN